MSDPDEIPFDRLASGERLFIWSARQWVGAASRGRCVCRGIDNAFGSLGLELAIDDFHLAMRSLYFNARVPLKFGQRDRSTLTGHEGALLRAFQHVSTDEEAVRRIACGIVHADFVPVLAKALCRISGHFFEAGHALACGPATSSGQESKTE